MNRIRKRLTYANVMSSIAVFLVLGGATAFAAANKIGANEIQANSIKTGKIVKEAVTAGKIKKAAVTESRIAAGAITSSKLAAGSVTEGALANEAVGNSKIKNGAVNAAKLAPGTISLSCPSGTTSVGGLCFENTERAASAYFAAVEACANAGRQLPQASQLISFAKKSALPNQEWSGGLFSTATGFAVNTDGTPATVALTTALAFRCVGNPAP